MEKLFICPKCKSENVRVFLKDGTKLKSIGKKLAVEEKFSDLPYVFNEAMTYCLDCKFEFQPKCLEESDVVNL